MTLRRHRADPPLFMIDGYQHIFVRSSSSTGIHVGKIIYVILQAASLFATPGVLMVIKKKKKKVYI